MTTAIICSRRTHPPVCYLPGCGKTGVVQCDYPVDRWGRTCGRHACHQHSESVGWNRDHCLEHAGAPQGGLDGP